RAPRPAPGRAAGDTAARRASRLLLRFRAVHDRDPADRARGPFLVGRAAGSDRAAPAPRAAAPARRASLGGARRPSLGPRPTPPPLAAAVRPASRAGHHRRADAAARRVAAPRAAP